MTIGEGEGWGKLILGGEHAVVYGHPAVALAVDLGTRVVVDTAGPQGVHSPFRDDRLDEALQRLLPSPDWALTITSDVPVGRGMGSSAALSVAIVRAVCRAEGRPDPGPDATFNKAMEAERVFHGNPSGLDVAVAVRGGAIVYRRTEEGPRFQGLPCPTWPLVVYDSGYAGNTRDLVAGVAARRPEVDPILSRLGERAQAMIPVLDDPAALGPLFTACHEDLRQIGVSTPELDALVALALRSGAYGAKLAGAGGGGVVIAVGPDPEAMVAEAARQGVNAFVTWPRSAP